MEQPAILAELPNCEVEVSGRQACQHGLNTPQQIVTGRRCEWFLDYLATPSAIHKATEVGCEGLIHADKGLSRHSGRW